MKGVVAAGHPVTAEAGAAMLREGGNAVDAAVAAVLASFAAESPLTGFGAGGFMLVHCDGAEGGESTLIDFFVEAPGREGADLGAPLIPVDVEFEPGAVQIFNVGAASCGVPGAAAGLAHAIRRFASMPAETLVTPAVAAAREGLEVTRQQGYLFRILAPIYTASTQLQEVYAPEGRVLTEGETFRFPQLGEDIERFGAEGAEPFYSGDIGQAAAEYAQGEGGILSAADLAAYEPVERAPVRVSYRGCEVLTNPPPSSGGILIAYALGLLERLGEPTPGSMVAAMGAANAARDAAFNEGLHEADFAERFLNADALDAAAGKLIGSGEPAPRDLPGDRLGSTTHITAIDEEGMCASVTCSNGTGSGVLVPGTAMHLNNMLGEEDLNPLGFHRSPPGRRLPSMMSPTMVLRGGRAVAGLGSAGSNRIRSAVLQTVVGMVDGDLEPAAAIEAPRLHFEAGVLQAEPGHPEESLRGLEEAGVPVVRWRERNLFFGGVQAVRRDPDGGLSGGGDPRRGGVAVRVG